MKITTRLLATTVLISSLIAPSVIQANDFVDNFLGWFSTTAGASAGMEVGKAAGKGIAHHTGEMIPNNLKKPLIIAAAVGLVVYLIYANREETPNHHRKAHPRCRACSNKGCPHTKCK